MKGNTNKNTKKTPRETPYQIIRRLKKRYVEITTKPEKALEYLDKRGLL